VTGIKGFFAVEETTSVRRLHRTKHSLFLKAYPANARAHVIPGVSAKEYICTSASSFLLLSSGAPYSRNMISLLLYCRCDSGSRESVSTGCWFCHGCRYFNFCSTATSPFPTISPLRLRSSSSTSPVLFLLLVAASVAQSPRFLAEISGYRINL